MRRAPGERPNRRARAAVAGALAAVLVVAAWTALADRGARIRGEGAHAGATPGGRPPAEAKGDRLPALATPGVATARGRDAPAAASASKGPTTRHAVLAIEVRDASGAPVPGAHVRAYGLFEWDAVPPRASVRAEGTTGKDGILALAVPVNRGETAWPGPVIVHAWTDDAAAWSEVLDPWAPDPRDVGRRAVTLRLAWSPTITGRVTSDEGVPVAGATVEVGDGSSMLIEATAGEDGAFRLPPIPADALGDIVRVAGRADGHAPAEVQLGVRDTRYLDVLLVLPRTHRVTLRCVDASGAAVPFDIGRSESPFGRLVVLDYERTIDVPRDAEVLVLPEAPYAPRKVRVAVDRSAGPLTVVVQEGGRIGGRIEVPKDFGDVDRSHGWWIVCRSRDLGSTVRWAQTGRDGRFVLDGIGPGEHVLSTEWGSHLASVQVLSGEVEGVHAGDSDARLPVHWVGIVRIVVRAAQDRRPVPLRSWRVEATGPSPEERVTVRSRPDRGRDEADAFWGEGFLVGLPRPGSYRIRVKVPGFAWAERDDVVVEGAAHPSGIDHGSAEFLVVPERP